MPRPNSITGLALALLALAAFNALGALTAYRELTFLRGLPLAVSPGYLLLSRAGWAVAWAALAVGVWRLARWARVGAGVALTLYVAQIWLDQWLFIRTDFAWITWPYLGAVSLLALGAGWGILYRWEWRP